MRAGQDVEHGPDVGRRQAAVDVVAGQVQAGHDAAGHVQAAGAAEGPQSPQVVLVVHDEHVKLCAERGLHGLCPPVQKYGKPASSFPLLSSDPTRRRFERVGGLLTWDP